MMNQQYGAFGHCGRCIGGTDRSPYRRPCARNPFDGQGMNPYSMRERGDMGGGRRGCGCVGGQTNGNGTEYPSTPCRDRNDRDDRYDRCDRYDRRDRDNRDNRDYRTDRCDLHDRNERNERDERRNRSGNRPTGRMYTENNNYNGNGNNHGGCGSCKPDCDAGNDCTKLLEQIRAVDFALYELILYLDVYPHSCDALETYHKLKARQKELYHAYETSCGPLTAFGNESTTSWDWTKKPFPWEYGAN